MNYFCTSVNFPGIQVPSVEQKTPFVTAPVPGTKPVYETLNIKFIVDEELFAYTTILDWIKGYSLPESFQGYKDLALQSPKSIFGTMANSMPQYSDAILTVYSNKNNPTLQLKFTDCYPEKLGSINFSTDMSAEAIITVEAVFRFTTYHINRLGTAVLTSDGITPQ